MLEKTGILSQSLQYMKYLQKGLSVHTDNLSRMDMPGAKAYEMKPFAEHLKKTSSGTIQTTSALHITPKKVSSGGMVVQSPRGASSSLSGNNITQEEQMSRINELTTESLKVNNLYKKGLSFIRTILGVKG